MKIHYYDKKNGELHSNTAHLRPLTEAEHRFAVEHRKNCIEQYKSMFPDVDVDSLIQKPVNI